MITPIQTKKQGSSVLPKPVIPLIISESKVFAVPVIRTVTKTLLEKHAHLMSVVFSNFNKKMVSVETVMSIPTKTRQERNVSPTSAVKDKR